MKKSDVVKVNLEDSEEAFVVGEKIFVRCVTYHLTGRIAAIKQSCGVGFLILEEAAWIPTSARFSNAINNGEHGEVEPVNGIVRVNINSIVDVFCWEHPLPRKQIG